MYKLRGSMCVAPLTRKGDFEACLGIDASGSIKAMTVCWLRADLGLAEGPVIWNHIAGL